MPAPRVIGTDAILESISDGVFTVDRDWKVTSFNRAAEETTGIPREEAIGRLCSDVLRCTLCESGCPLRQTLETGQPLVNQAAVVIDSDGGRIPISLSTAVLRDEGGRIVGGAETFRDLSLVEALREELRGRFRLGDLVSRSPSMREVFDLVAAVAPSESTVLVQGETGTGKELVAKAIHGLSQRAEGPFVAVNCGAFPDTLLESELFGHVAGAFTGAVQARRGRFASAEGGTLLLDEIGETSPAMQVRLLRVLQERSYEPLGSSTPVRADVRIIAATNRDLAVEVERGNLREDLYYRVHVVGISLPPLRERKEDIGLLAEHFVERFNQLQDKDVTGVGPEAMALLLTHDWPGNVRELENALEHTFVLCNEGLIQPRHLPRELAARRRPGRGGRASLEAIVQEAEAQAIRDALARNGNCRIDTARDLGIHKSTLFRKVRALGIDLPPDDGRTSARHGPQSR